MRGVLPIVVFIFSAMVVALGSLIVVGAAAIVGTGPALGVVAIVVLLLLPMLALLAVRVSIKYLRSKSELRDNRNVQSND